MALITSTVPAGLGMQRPLLVFTKGRSSAAVPRSHVRSRAVEIVAETRRESSERCHRSTAPLTSLPVPPQLAPLASKAGAVAGAAVLSTGLSWFASTPAAQAAAEGVTDAASVTPEQMGMGLLVYAAQTLISWGIPTAAGLFLVLVATARRGGSKGSDAKPGSFGFLKQFQKGAGGEGTPKEYLTITPLNEILDSYTYSLTKTTGNKARATAEARRRTYKDKFGDTVGDLSDEAIEKVLKVIAPPGTRAGGGGGGIPSCSSHSCRGSQSFCSTYPTSKVTPKD